MLVTGQGIGRTFGDEAGRSCLGCGDRLADRNSRRRIWRPVAGRSPILAVGPRLHGQHGSDQFCPSDTSRCTRLRPPLDPTALSVLGRRVVGLRSSTVMDDRGRHPQKCANARGDSPERARSMEMLTWVSRPPSPQPTCACALATTSNPRCKPVSRFSYPPRIIVTSPSHTEGAFSGDALALLPASTGKDHAHNRRRGLAYVRLDQPYRRALA